ncbi:MAG TPA: type II CAAX endopeptidase family protein [Candidatus Binatia bacterium]|nr:type II CAAX endopeptidase family protein [Candidatus Binatia bacterium]
MAPPPPAPPRVSRALTLLAAVVLVAFVTIAVRLHAFEPRLAAVAEPERALALLVGRTLDVETALTAAPAWERRLYALTLGDPGRELEQALAWYEELADYSLAPGVDLRLAILRGEAGRRGPLARALDEWQARGEPLATYADVIAAAYLDAGEIDPDAVGDAVAVLGPGWFADVLALRLAVRFDEPALGATARRSIAARAGPLLWRLRALSLGDVILLAAGGLALLALRRRPPEARVASAAPLPPPWPLGAGLAALVRGGAVSALALMLVLAGQPWLAERPLVAEAVTAPAMYLPVVLLAWRLLLVPAGAGFAAVFGLRPRSGGWRPLVLSAVLLAGAGVVLDAGLALGSTWLPLDSHWTEWFDADLAWGPAAAVAVTLVSTVVLAPVFEEIIFRGLLYGSLRARLGVWPSVVASALVFALAHGYGAAGFASVFLSGALWAWSYERTRSLLPGIAAHMANNAAVGVTLLWLLR